MDGFHYYKRELDQMPDPVVSSSDLTALCDVTCRVAYITQQASAAIDSGSAS